MFVILSNFCTSEEDRVAAVTVVVAGEEKRERNHTWRGAATSLALYHTCALPLPLPRSVHEAGSAFFCPPVTSHVETASQRAAEQGREGGREGPVLRLYGDAGGLQQQP